MWFYFQVCWCCSPTIDEIMRSLSSQTPQPLDDAIVKEFQNDLGCLESKGRKEK